MPLNPGTRLGPYEILAPLGAGGMGEVYRAKDSRLGRDVAIKVLPQHLTENPEVRARFEREAKTISQLNHPHICTLFDVGREGATDYLVMELVDGETLAHRLGRGPLPVRDILKLGVEIADALDRAHRAGIIHRDLKPANIMLVKSGAKLMDFGLARATGVAGAGGSGVTAALTQSPTIAQPLTSEGTIVGTFQYMSPEQLEGREADARSDIWALGCVLYEMATGKRPFEGRSQATLIAAILDHDPPPISEVRSSGATDIAGAALSSSSRRGEVPPGLERVVRQCLAKDPDDRWQSAGDLKRELDWISSGSGSGARPVEAGARPRAKRRWAAIGVAVLAGIVSGVLGAVLLPGGGGKPEAPLVRFTIAAPHGYALSAPAEAELSPDGTMLVFVVSDSVNFGHVCVRALGAVDARVLPGTEHASLPFWSPDSRTVGFFANGKLLKVGLDGTPPVALCDAPDPRGGAWSKDGVILFAPNNQGPIARVPAAGGQPVPVTRVNAARHEFGHRYPQILPDGKHFLYVAVGATAEFSVYASPIAGGAPVEITRSVTGARFAPPGYLLKMAGASAVQQQRLLVTRFDPGRLRASGDAELLIDDVKTTNFGYVNASADGRGTLVVQHWPNPHLRILFRGRTGASLGSAILDVEGFPPVSVSPDGRYLAYYGVPAGDLFVHDVTTGVSRRFTFDGRSINNVIWTHDGRWIVYGEDTGTSGYEIRRKAADGSGGDSTLFHGPGLFSYPMAVSRDGRWLVANCSDSTGAYDLWCIPLAGQGSPHVYQRTPFNETGASLSPDGRWLVYGGIEEGKGVVYIQSFPDPGAKYQLAVDSPIWATWTDKGDGLLVGNEKSEVLLVGADLSAGFRQGSTQRLFQTNPPEFVADVVPGEQRFVIATVDLRPLLGTLEVVLDWPRLLEKK